MMLMLMLMVNKGEGREEQEVGSKQSKIKIKSDSKNENEINNKIKNKSKAKLKNSIMKQATVIVVQEEMFTMSKIVTLSKRYTVRAAITDNSTLYYTDQKNQNTAIKLHA